MFSVQCYSDGRSRLIFAGPGPVPANFGVCLFKLVKIVLNIKKKEFDKWTTKSWIPCYISAQTLNMLKINWFFLKFVWFKFF